MLNNLRKRLARSEEKQRLLSNTSSLVALQGVNYLLPLLTLPYLVRVLGPEHFGLLAFATALITYFVLLTDYGFNLSATRQISLHRDDKDKVIEIFSSVMMIKAFLMVISFCLMVLLVFGIDQFRGNWQIYLTTFGIVIGQVLFPAWLFQGLERMKYITYYNILAKALFTGCIFIFVKNQSDYLLVPVFTSLGFIVAGLFSLYFIRKEFNVSFQFQAFDVLNFQLAEGWHVFLSSLAISLYTISATVILGLFASSTVVGYFAAADRIVQAVKGIYSPVSQAIYPLASKKFHENRSEGLAFIKQLTKFVGLGMLALSVILFLFSDAIVVLILGEQYRSSIILLRIMAFLPFIIALSNIFGIQVMLNLGYKQAFSAIAVAAAVLGLSLNLVLVPVYKSVGTAAALLLVEVFVTFSMFFYLKIKFRENS